MRSGLITKKVGMSSVFDELGNKVAVTFLEIKNCQVVDQKVKEKHGYDAILLGYEDIKLDKIAKPQRKLFANNSIAPKKHLKEFSNYNELVDYTQSLMLKVRRVNLKNACELCKNKELKG